MKQAGLTSKVSYEVSFLQSLFNFEGPVKRNLRRIWASTAKYAIYSKVNMGV